MFDYKKISSSVLFWAYVITLIAPSHEVSAAAVVPISAPTAILIDANSQRVFYSKTPHMRRAPASTTKILTAIVSLDQAAPDRVVTIPGFVTKIEPSKAYLKPGERYYVRDLVKLILINSSNDAAETLGWAIGGSRSGFSALMNKKVRSLGCENSNFVNASGLPDTRQYSTAYDMSLIVRAAQKYPLIVEAMKIRTGSIRSVNGKRKIGLRNHNKMLWRSSRSVLGKTGWTRAARHCFVGFITVSNQKVYVALLGSRRLWKDLKALVDYQFGSSVKKKKGDRPDGSSTEARRIQKALKQHGYYTGPITGFIGPLTRKAIKRFQKAHGIEQTGNVGPKTIAKLNSL